MACDMIESCITRTDQAFQQWLKKGTGFVSTDYVLPSEMCAMVNVILDAKNQSFKLCAVDGVDVVRSLIYRLSCLSYVYVFIYSFIHYPQAIKTFNHFIPWCIEWVQWHMRG